MGTFRRKMELSSARYHVPSGIGIMCAFHVHLSLMMKYFIVANKFCKEKKSAKPFSSKFSEVP